MPILPAFGQELTARPDRGMSSKGSYQTSDIDAISLQNGAVSVSIPLASLPPIAGGKLSYTLTAQYNSKIWNVNRKELIAQTGEPGCPQKYSTAEVTTAEGNAGWRIGGQYQVYFRDAHEDYDYYSMESSDLCDGYEFYYMQGRFFKPILRMPDGSEKELRMTGPYPTYSAQGNRDHLKGYYKDTSTGGYPMFSSPTRMHTLDGSYISVIVNPPGSPVISTVYMKDGTSVDLLSDGTQRTKDTNGNSILYSANSVKDEGTGREIKWSQIDYNGQNATKVEYQTVGGAWQTTMVVWGETTVRGKLYHKYDWSSYGSSGCFKRQEFQNTFGVIREIILPVTEQNVAARKFTFGYNSDTTAQHTSTNIIQTCGQLSPDYTRTVSTGLGELSDVTTPTGTQIKYNYANDGVHDIGMISEDGPDEVTKDAVTSKVVSHDGTTDTWQYAISLFGGYSVGGGSVTNPDGSTYAETYNPTNIAFSGSGGSNGMSGLMIGSNQSGRVRNQKKWVLLGGVQPQMGAQTQSLGVNPAVEAEFTTLLDGNGNTMLMKARKYQYDYNGEVLQTIEYDWFAPNDTMTIPANATVLRTINNSYYNQAADVNSPNAYQTRSVGSSTAILGAMQETVTGVSQTASQVRFIYDGQGYGNLPIKGNITTVSSWDNSTNSWINTSSTYDSYGNVATTTDPIGKIKQNFYEDATHAMPTKTIVDPQNGSGQQISTTLYDFSTGAVLSQTDINGNLSNIDYINHLLGTVDPHMRPGTVLNPVTNIGGVNKRQTIKTFYEDSVRRIHTESDLFDQNDGVKKRRETRDQIGRTVLTEENENGNSSYTIFAHTIYAESNRVMMKSNPTRNQNGTTDGWTRTTKDTLGRTIETAMFAGSTQPNLTGTGLNWMGSVISAYEGNITLITDQAGKQRRSVTNGNGQLIRVDEPDATGNLGSVANPTQLTNYTYDTLGNLIQVSQGGQTRSFQYDSLSRLRQEIHPESGTTSYNYDANGNLVQKIDARSVQTNFLYDALNRITQRSYANLPSTVASTPSVTYTYDDPNIAFSKGKLTKISSAIFETRYTGFDNLGRVLSSQQLTDGQTYNFGYQYNLAGMLVQQTYPSGRTVSNQFGLDGNLAQVTGAIAGISKTYAGNFNYASTGAVEAVQLGNGRWETTQFNARLQPIQIGLGTAANDQSLLKLNFGYGANNNGNILSQQITIAGQFQATQVYTYDPLNRLKSAEENNGQSWKQIYTYDRYGNRNFDAGQTTTLGGCPANVCNPTVDQTNNRLVGYQYDLAGNTTQDAEQRQFVYDAENKQVQVKNAQGVDIGTYFYDGDGKRVKKVAAQETTLFAYDASGKLAAEYTMMAQASPTSQTSYLISDHLGSPRITTKQDGTVQSRRDFMPFGEEITGLGNRSAAIGYQADTIRQKFTGYEKDNETDLNFAQARYYSSTLGRFLVIDPSPKSVIQKKPQSWNKYLYCYNNPLILIDKNGMWPTGTHDALTEQAFEGLKASEIGMIKLGNQITDYISGGRPGSTLWPSEAHKHAMTQEGLTPEKAVEKANGFLQDQMTKAASAQKDWEASGRTGLSPGALQALGEAIHTYQDLTSPAHGFDKTYSIPTKTGTVTLPDGSLEYETADGSEFMRQMGEHKKEESGKPTKEQIAKSKLYSRAFFLIAFGEEKFSQLVMTDDERKAVRDLAAKTRNAK